MFLKKIKTPGLSHLSYILGSNGKAAVIDPRRDCEIYLEIASQQGLEITHIFETHRNEDLITGSPHLGQMTKAKIYHGPNAAGPIAFADIISDQQEFKIGNIKVVALETPGHTKDHVAYAFYDENHDDGAVGVFTGDALFVGDVGRTDFYPDEMKEMAGALYDSLHKVMDLGDQALIYPAHGAGSVCGSGMAEREFSSICHERKNNPRLQLSKAEFVDAKVNEVHYQPPYFENMERLNLVGAGPVPRVLVPKVLSFSEFKGQRFDVLIDVRDTMSFASGHMKGAISLPVGMLPAFGGWFLNKDQKIGLIGDSMDQLSQAMEHLWRIGFDDIVGGYTGFVKSVAQGGAFDRIPTLSTRTVKKRIEEADENWVLLDVRAQDEVEKIKIDEAQHVYIGHLNEAWEDLDPQKHYTLMCASGQRATVAAGWLQSKGFSQVDIYLGSMGAWQAER